jgi:alginate O-acetyltransferase complex protein AlgJ
MQTQTLLRLSRFILPVAFLGYAAYANVAILDGPEAEKLAQFDGSLIQGEVTATLGSTYARAMPHREPAVALVGAARYLLASEGRQGVVVGQDGWLFTDEERKVATEAQIARAVDEALAAQARLAELGARLIVVPLPAKVDIERDRSPDPAMSQAMEEQHGRFLAALEAAGIAAVDVRPALVGAAQDGRAFLARDTHWTPDGATAVAEAIAASGLVPRGTDEFMRRHSDPENVEGDLVSFVTSPGLAPTLGLGPQKITPFVAEATGSTAGGIFAAEAPAITTLLVGTSYSADARWSFAPALSLTLGRDVLNLAQAGQGPITPLRALLDDPGLSLNPPEYVIWEVPVRYLGEDSIWAGHGADAGAALEGSL